MKTTKFHLLHIRVDAEQYEDIHKHAASRPSRNISDIVREAVSLITSVSEGQSSPITLTGKMHEVLATLALELNRSPAKVAEECVTAVNDSFRYNRSPLIVEELKLRRLYTDYKSSR